MNNKIKKSVFLLITSFLGLFSSMANAVLDRYEEDMSYILGEKVTLRKIGGSSLLPRFVVSPNSCEAMFVTLIYTGSIEPKNLSKAQEFEMAGLLKSFDDGNDYRCLPFFADLESGRLDRKFNQWKEKIKEISPALNEYVKKKYK